MSYQVLARKWRPQKFDDVVGQGHITQTLQNAITTKRLAHAFLFSGPRGVGKTTTARILAKALNCVEGPTPLPCGKCDSCLETTAGNSVDVIEIDGASNRGIEHIRELREAVKYAPVGGRYKVYVIDEVHMLTNEAFNALLKTLEEPPPHVIFIFATTEPQKIPATIHSRCQRYSFKRISLSELTGRLRMVANAEHITISDQSLSLIARAAEGSMRDAQSLLDQAISFSGLEITDADIQAMLGSVAQITLQKITTGLFNQDAAGLLKHVDELLEQGQDMRLLLSSVVEHLRNVLVIKIAKEPGRIVELPPVDIDIIRQQGARIEADRLLMLFDSLSKTLEDMRWSPHQRFTLEIGLVKACNLSQLKPLSEVLTHIRELEMHIVSGNPSSNITRVNSESVQKTSSVAQTIQYMSSGSSAETDVAQDDMWSKMLHVLKTKKPNIASLLAHGRFIEVTDTKLVIGIPGRFQFEQAEKPDNRQYIQQTAEEVFHKKIQVINQPIIQNTNAEVKTKNPTKKPDASDAAVQNVLQVFTEGEVIEQSNSDE